MKIAVAQISCSLGDSEANLAKVHDLSRTAKDVGAELIVFPEMTDTGYSISVIQKYAGHWKSGFVPGLEEIASELSIAIVRRVGTRWIINLQFPGSRRCKGRHCCEISQDSSLCGRTRRRTNLLCAR